MKKSLTRVAALCFLLAVALVSTACGDAKLDTSNDKTYSESLGKIYDGLPEEKRQEFERYFSAALSEIPGFGRGQLNREDFFQVYDLLKLFGNEGVAALQKFNGLTADEIIAKGREAEKTRSKEQLAEAKQGLANIKKKIDDRQKLELERAKVKVEIGEVQVLEGKDRAGKPWGTIGFLKVPVTIVNGSDQEVPMVDGKVNYTYESGKEIHSLKLGQELKRNKDDFVSLSLGGYDLEIAPGESWTGEVTLFFRSKDKKFPYPPTEKFGATLSDVVIKFRDENKDFFRSPEEDNEILERQQKYIADLEKELAAL